MAERFTGAPWSLADAAAILGARKVRSFRRTVERLALRWPGRTRFVVDDVEVTKRDGRWWFRFGPRWTKDGKPLRWVTVKAAAVAGGQSAGARYAQLRRKAKAKRKSKRSAAGSATELRVAEARVARFGKPWLVALGPLYEAAERATSERTGGRRMNCSCITRERRAMGSLGSLSKVSNEAPCSLHTLGTVPPVRFGSAGSLP